MPNLTIIVTSTRPGRAGLAVGEWFAERARVHGAFDVSVVDLAVVNLPLLDEPELPRLRRYRNEHTRDWSATVDGADAFVFVTPEYNHGYPATLKNAIDYLHDEWASKPLGFVSYGGRSGGTRAVAQLRQVVDAIKMLPLAQAVSIRYHTEFLDDSGRLHPNEITEQAAVAMLDALVQAEAILRRVRLAPTEAA
jgi:NAD(P)H-dependent FMN reductase